MHDDASNSIGALLEHIAAVERHYQILTFEERQQNEDEIVPWLPALDLGGAGRREVRGRPLESYLATLDELRARRSRL